MAKQTLFSMLMRSPWWLSFVIAAAMFALVRVWLPDMIAISAALPFAGIGAYAAWVQMRDPGAVNVSERLAALRQMTWENFSTVMAEAFAREGYAVQAISGPADFELRKNGRVTLASCRRWKVTQAGAGPLRELDAERRARDAHACLYVAAGDVTSNARAYAEAHRIEIVSHAALVKLVGRLAAPRRRWFAR